MGSIRNCAGESRIWSGNAMHDSQRNSEPPAEFQSERQQHRSARRHIDCTHDRLSNFRMWRSAFSMRFRPDRTLSVMQHRGGDGPQQKLPVSVMSSRRKHNPGFGHPASLFDDACCRRSRYYFATRRRNAYSRRLKSLKHLPRLSALQGQATGKSIHCIWIAEIHRMNQRYRSIQTARHRRHCGPGAATTLGEIDGEQNTLRESQRAPSLPLPGAFPLPYLPRELCLQGGDLADVTDRAAMRCAAGWRKTAWNRRRAVPPRRAARIT